MTKVKLKDSIIRGEMQILPILKNTIKRSTTMTQVIQNVNFKITNLVFYGHETVINVLANYPRFKFANQRSITFKEFNTSECDF